MNILIDLDGTLTDSKRGIIACIRHGLRSLGYEAPDESHLVKYVGPPLLQSFRAMLPPDKISEAERALAAYRERFVAVGMFENDVYAGIPDALRALRDRGARLFVATSKPEVYAKRILEHFELAQFFEAIYGSELDGRLTEKTDLIAHVLAESRLNRADTWMIGDRKHDALGAVANGVRPIGVLWGYGSHDELMSAGVETLLAVPGELAHLSFTRGN